MKRTLAKAITSPRPLIAALASLLVLAAFSSMAHAQCEIMVQKPTNTGTDFLLCYEQNDQPGSNSGETPTCYVYVASVADQEVTVTIKCKHYPLMQQKFTLQSHGTVTWAVTDSFPDIWIGTRDDSINDRCVQVHADGGSIVCYGMNYKLNTSDAFLALPKTSSGPDYRIMSYTNSHYVVDATPSQFCVAAFQDNTNVKITPAANTLSNPTSRTGHAAGQAFTVTLNAGECLQVQTDPTIVDVSDPNPRDLTGSIVEADNPVAVYAGHARSEIPFNYEHDNTTSRDILLEQMPPSNTWGTQYVVSAIEVDAAGNKRVDGDLIRVLAKEDSTRVMVNGKLWCVLKSGQYADSMVKNFPWLIESNKGILVGEYAHTSTSVRGDNGDPFLAIVPSMDQTYHDYTFFVSDNPVFVVQKVIITAKAACINSISLDGQPIPAAFFTAPANALPLTADGKQYYICQLAVTSGAHRLTTTQQPEDGFSILQYGLGFVVSYGYTAGQLLVPKSGLVIGGQPRPVFGHSPNQNRVELRNITFDDLYLDQAVFTPDNPDDARFNIHIREALDPENGRLASAGSGALHLTTSEQLDRAVPGTLTIYNHEFTWGNLTPASAHWTYYPEMSAADVAQDATTDRLQAEIYPNPITTSDGTSVLTFQMPESADLAITIYDELGRPARTMAAANYGQGQHEIRILKQQAEAALPPGTYRIALRSNRLNVATNLMLIVQ